ncbi:MAG: hypothetical protein QF752_05640 [Planctomycetota bacterium]|jgi:hypothetical protein|nr:hypothetical protein [Planctomycetota bacterium]
MSRWVSPGFITISVPIILAVFSPLGFAQADANETDQRVIVAVGYGIEPARYFRTGRGRLMARRAAQLDALRNLSERMLGLRIDSTSTVRDFVMSRDLVRTHFQTFLKGASVQGYERTEDGMILARVQIGVDGLRESLAETARQFGGEQFTPEMMRRISYELDHFQGYETRRSYYDLTLKDYVPFPKGHQYGTLLPPSRRPKKESDSSGKQDGKGDHSGSEDNSTIQPEKSSSGESPPKKKNPGGQEKDSLRLRLEHPGEIAVRSEVPVEERFDADGVVDSPRKDFLQEAPPESSGTESEKEPLAGSKGELTSASVFEPETRGIPKVSYVERKVYIPSRYLTQIDSQWIVVILFPRPLGLQQVLMEHVPDDIKLVEGTWKTNAPWGFPSLPKKMGKSWAIRAPGATLISYGIGGNGAELIRFRGEIVERGRSGSIDLVRSFPGLPVPEPPRLDQKQPELFLATPGKDQVVEQEVDSIVVAGTVADGSGIRSILMRRSQEEAPVDLGTGDVLSRTQRHQVVPFKGRIPLKVGSNEFEIIAVDIVGNRSVLEFVVRRGY